MRSGPRLFSTSPIEPVASAQEQHIPLHNGLGAQPHTGFTQALQAFHASLSADASASLSIIMQSVTGCAGKLLAGAGMAYGRRTMPGGQDH